MRLIEIEIDRCEEAEQVVMDEGMHFDSLASTTNTTNTMNILLGFIG
jgi:hypothetical protein